MPRSFADHRARFDAMVTSDAIVPSLEAKTIGRFLLAPPTPIVVPLTRWTRAMTAGLMPARLRDAFELPFGPIERAVFATSAPARVHDRASPLLRRHWMGDHLASHPRSATIAR